MNEPFEAIRVKQLFETVEKAAYIVGNFRYTLLRRWADGPSVLWIMLNPSTADADKDDPTIRRCIGLTKGWDFGYGAIEVVNLFAFRTSDPKELKAYDYPIGEANDLHIETLSKSAGLVMAAWGAHAPHNRAKLVLNCLLRNVTVNCLGYCKCGCPRHPLMVPNGNLFTEFVENYQ